MAAFPADAGPEAFDWRLSVAEIAGAGPFSPFPGADRYLAVLDGALELRFGDEPAGRLLSPDDGAIGFSGDIMVTGRPIGSSVRALNLMVRRDRWTGRLRAPNVAGFTTTASTTLIIARVPGAIAVDGATFPLLALDAIMAGPGIRVRAPVPSLFVAEVDPLGAP